MAENENAQLRKRRCGLKRKTRKLKKSQKYGICTRQAVLRSHERVQMRADILETKGRGELDESTHSCPRMYPCGPKAGSLRIRERGAACGIQPKKGETLVLMGRENVERVRTAQKTFLAVLFFENNKGRV